jgi:hypothetical protein
MRQFQPQRQPTPVPVEPRPATPRPVPPVQTTAHPPILHVVDWTTKRDWLAKLQWFRDDPRRLETLDCWNHPLQGVYQMPNGIWCSSYQPRIIYSASECVRCHLIGHIRWNCPTYKCVHCGESAPGHKPLNCPKREYVANNHHSTVLRVDVPPPLMPLPPAGFSIKDLEDLLTSCREKSPGPVPPPPPTTEESFPSQNFPFSRTTTPPFAVPYRPPQARQLPTQPTPVIPTRLRADVEQPRRPSRPLPQRPLPRPPRRETPQLPSRRGTPNRASSRRPRNLPYHPPNAVAQEASRRNRGHSIRVMRVTDDSQILSVQPERPRTRVYDLAYNNANTLGSWRRSPDRPPPPYTRAQSRRAHRVRTPSPYRDHGPGDNPHLTNVDDRYY